MTETRTCAKCGKQMIQRQTGPMLLSCPPQQRWIWWCACGHTEEGGTRRALTEEEQARREWGAVNPLVSPVCTICGLSDGELLDNTTIAGLPEEQSIHRDCFNRVWDAVFDRSQPGKLVGEIKAEVGEQVRRERMVNDDH
jgi:hypothetical protein